MNCYECKHRGNLPGSAHSRCNFIKHLDNENGGVIEMMYMLGKFKFTKKNENGEEESAIKLNPHGVKNGWANWPIDFDPIWVDECLFHESLQSKEKTESNHEI